MTYEEWLASTGAYQYSDGGEGAGTGGWFHDSLLNGDGGISAGTFSGDNTPEQQLRAYYDSMMAPGADGRLPWGTEGLAFDSSGNAGSFFNQGSVTIDGQNYNRVSEDPSTWQGMDDLGHQVRTWLGENQGPQATYNDQYGWLMPEQQYAALSEASETDGQMDSSFTNWAPTAIMSAITAGAGALAAPAAGAGLMTQAAAKIPSLISAYGSSQVNGGGTPWASLLGSGLGMGYSALGGSDWLSSLGEGSTTADSVYGNLYGTYGAAGNTAYPNSWNMYANSGQIMNDASSFDNPYGLYEAGDDLGADNWASEYGGNDYSQYSGYDPSNPYGLYEAPNDTGADNWDPQYGGNQYTSPTNWGGSTIGKLLTGLLGGSGSGSGSGTGGLQGADLIKLLGILGSTGAGIYGANQQADAYKQTADKYMALGAPFREKLEASYAPGFDITKTDPSYQGALDSASNSVLKGLSVTKGNPFDNPGAVMEANKYVTQNTALPHLNTYRSQLGSFGQLGTNTAGTASLNGAAGAGGTANALGYGLNSLTSDNSAFEDYMKKYMTQNGTNQFKLNTGGYV